ncbi:type IV secretion protein Rhs, partial [Lysobacter pythonis]
MNNQNGVQTMQAHATWHRRLASVLSLGGLLFVAGMTGAAQISGSGVEPGTAQANADSTVGHADIRVSSGRMLRLLPDGRTLQWLDTARPARPLRRWELPETRREATLTRLASGEVLLFGGMDERGVAQPDGYRFVPATQSLRPFREPRLMARAGHTATVLTDGSVLFAGGRSGTPAQRWRGGDHVVPVAGLAHYHRTAELQADGRVLLLGGGQGKARDAQVFDPATDRLSPLAAQARPSTGMGDAPRVAATLPARQASDVAVETRLAVRFSQRMREASLVAGTVSLIGPVGQVAVDVVPAERGRLLFVKPRQPLLPATAYSLLVDGAKGVNGKTLPLLVLDFWTETLHARDTAKATSPPARPASRYPAGFLGCGKTRPYPCRPRSRLQQGFWTPGRDNTAAHWRTSGNLESVPDMQPLAAVAARHRTTVVTGRIRSVDGRAVAGVEVSLGQRVAKTNAHGDFVLTGVPTGRQELYVDGSAAKRGDTEYGQFVMGVDVAAAGRLTQVPHVMYLPRIHPRDKVAISSPLLRDTVLTHPDMPGLQVLIPKGTVIRDRKGRIVRELALVPTPVNRAPFPVSDNYPMYFTIEPGGAVVQGLDPASAKGIRVLYPNYDAHPAGTRANFWIYDPQEGWRMYGQGRVTSDGSRFAPEAGVGLHQVMGGGYSLNTDDPGPEEGMPPDCQVCGNGNVGTGGNATSGDPVDLRTGQFTYSETDLVIADTLPIQIGRTYRPHDNVKRSFGYGTAFNYDYRLNIEGAGNSAMRLVLPNGVPLDFQRVSGSGASGEWRHTGNGQYHQARLYYRNTRYHLKLVDGTAMQFNNYAPNRLESISNRYGQTLRFTWDAGRLARITSPNGRYVNLEYDDQDRIQTVRDPLGNATQYRYGSHGLLERVIYPNDTSRRYEYTLQPFPAGWTGGYRMDAYSTRHFHRVSAIYDQRGQRLLYNEYSRRRLAATGDQPAQDLGPDQVIKQILADGATYTFDYAHLDQGVPGVLVTMPDGVRRRVVFDGDGLYPQSDVWGYGTADAQTYRFERDGQGRLTARIDSLGRRTEYRYDGAGQLIAIEALAGSPQSRTTGFSYDSAQRLTALRTPLGQTLRFAYDATGCLIASTDALGQTTRFGCDGAGQLTHVTTPLGQTTRVDYVAGQVARITDPLGRVATLRYDALGRRIAVQSPDGSVQRVEYDTLGRVVKSYDGRGQATEYGYDANGNLSAVLKPHGLGETYDYDARDRLIQRTDNLGQSERWVYDLEGRPTRYTDRQGQVTTYAYDALGRLSTVTHPDGGTSVSAYDGGDRLLSLSDSQAGTLQWTYSPFDERLSETSAGGVVQWRYDAGGRRISMQAGTQPAVNYEWDAGNRLRRITQGSEHVRFGYDADNRLIEQILPNAVKQAYVYNAADQLTGIGWADKDDQVIGSLGYGYHPQSGRLSAQTGSYAPQLLPPASQGDNTFDANHRQTRFEGTALHYDANGNLTEAGGRRYVWNARNQLVEVREGAQLVASYRYDALGRRIVKQENGGTIEYLYDGLNPIQEKAGETINPILTGLGIDEYYARNEAIGRTYFLSDHQNSTRALTNAAGQVVNRYDYDPYGNARQSKTGFSNPYQYTGRERDQTGLMYYRARYYRPDMGRFIAEDPIGLAGGLNTYAYVGGNPISWIDPYGLQVMVCRDPAFNGKVPAHHYWVTT